MVEFRFWPELDQYMFPPTLASSSTSAVNGPVLLVPQLTAVIGNNVSKNWIGLYVALHPDFHMYSMFPDESPVIRLVGQGTKFQVIV